MQRIRLASLILFYLFLSNTVLAMDYSVSLGSAPQSAGGGLSLAIGLSGANNWGIDLGAIFNSEYATSDVLDYPVPHSDYTMIGEKYVGHTFGMDVLYFLSNSDSFRPYIGAGFYVDGKKQLARSNLTGFIYTQSDKSTTTASGEIGFRSKTVSGRILGLSFNTVRGISFSIGKDF